MDTAKEVFSIIKRKIQITVTTINPGTSAANERVTAGGTVSGIFIIIFFVQ